jgi:hypothetical protein
MESLEDTINFFARAEKCGCNSMVVRKQSVERRTWLGADLIRGQLRGTQTTCVDDHGLHHDGSEAKLELRARLTPENVSLPGSPRAIRIFLSSYISVVLLVELRWTIEFAVNLYQDTKSAQFAIGAFTASLWYRQEPPCLAAAA